MKYVGDVGYVPLVCHFCWRCIDLLGLNMGLAMTQREVLHPMLLCMCSAGGCNVNRELPYVVVCCSSCDASCLSFAKGWPLLFAG